MLSLVHTKAPPGPENGETAKDSRTEVIAKSRRPRKSVRLYVTPREVQCSLAKTLAAMPGSSASTQESRLEVELRKWPLTSYDMLRLGLFDPRARIKGLRNKGLNIVRTWVNIETDCGEQHRIGLFTFMRGTKGGAA